MEVRYSDKEYEEIEKLILSRVETLRSIMQDKHKIIVPVECTEFLERVLRLKDGNLEKAISFTKTYHVSVPYIHRFNAVVQPSQYEEIYNSGVFTRLRGKDFLDRPIFILRLVKWDVEKVSFDQLVVAAWLMSEVLNSQNKYVQRNGIHCIYDFSGFTFKHFLALKLWKFAHMLKLMQQGIGGRFKGFHFVNFHKIAALTYSCIKPFVQEKLKKRIHVYPDIESLQKKYDYQFLPDYLGGGLTAEESFDTDFVQEVLKSDYHFEDIRKYGFPTK